LILFKIKNSYSLFKEIFKNLLIQSLLPLLPPALLVLSVGMGVTSSILPIFMPKRAKALNAA